MGETILYGLLYSIPPSDGRTPFLAASDAAWAVARAQGFSSVVYYGSDADAVGDLADAWEWASFVSREDS